MIKLEYLFGLFSLIAVGSSYYVVTEAREISSEMVASHNNVQYAHPLQLQGAESLRNKVHEVDASMLSIQKDVEYNRERGDLIQTQNNAAHERQEELLNKILQKLDNIQ